MKNVEVTGSCERLLSLGSPQVDSGCNDGRFTVDWEVGGPESGDYRARFRLAKDTRPFYPGSIRIAGIDCGEGAGCNRFGALDCRFDSNNVVHCQGKSVDLTGWLDELPQTLYAVIESCVHREGSGSCSLRHWRVEFR